MKQLQFKAYEEDGKMTYIYELPEEAELDEDVLDLCEEGKLRGIASMEYVDDADAFYYDVTGYKTVGKALSGEVDASDVLDVLYRMANVFVDFKESGIPLSYLVLHKDFIFIDRMTMKVKFLCQPVYDDEQGNTMTDIAKFIRVLLSGLTYDITEDGSYVTKLITLVNTTDQFNTSILMNVLQDLMDEYQVPYEVEDYSDDYVELDMEATEVEAEEVIEAEAVAESVEDAMEAEEEDADVDMSALEGMPESVSVAEMEAAALREEELQAKMAAEEVSEEPVVESVEEIAVEEVAEPEVEVVAEEVAEPEAEVVTEEVAEPVVEPVEEEVAEPEAEVVVEEVAEPEAEAVAEEVVEPVVEAVAEEVVEPIEEPEKKPAKKSSKKKEKTLAEIQEEEERKLEEKNKDIMHFIGRDAKLDLEIAGLEDHTEDLSDVIKAVQEAVGDENAEVELPEELAKPETSETESETVVHPVFDSVFEPDIEFEGEEKPKVNNQKAIRSASLAARMAMAQAKEEVPTEDSVVNSDSILSQDINNQDEPSLLSQLNNRADNLPKVNPYLIRVNNEERIMITKHTFKIGKASFGMDYTVTDNGAISRNHCTILAKDGVYYIRDNKSTNHTYVNGQMVKNGQDVLLTHESKLMIADEEFLFKLR